LYTGGIAFIEDIRVEKQFQRQGVGNAMALLGQQIIGVPLSNVNDGDDELQTPAARAMWASPDRPFGRPPTK
jgi:hypothetical protein